MLNRNTIIFIVAILIIAAVLIAGLIYRGNPAINTSPEPTPQTSEPAPEEHEHSDEIPEIFIGNFGIVRAVFTDSQYIFINDSIHNFALDNYPLSQGLQVDESTFLQRDATSWGFSVADQSGTRLFHVIAAKQPDNTVKVDFYKL